LNNTSSTLRQEAISITRVRCKRRKTWIRSPSSPTQSSNNNNKTKSSNYIQQHRLKTNLIQPFLSNNQSEKIFENSIIRTIQRINIQLK
jgi:hypothetical protein